MTYGEDFRQCKCSHKVPHDAHCWICGAPIVYSISVEVRITSEGSTARVCDRPTCLRSADGLDALYGIPPDEVLRRRRWAGWHERQNAEKKAERVR